MGVSSREKVATIFFLGGGEGRKDKSSSLFENVLTIVVKVVFDLFWNDQFQQI